jgi:hypothetical protein
MTPEEKYLRNRSSYLAPNASLKLKMVTRVLFGFLVNAAFLGSFLLLIGRAAGYLAAYVRPSLMRGSSEVEAISLAATPGTGFALTVLAAFAIIGLALVFLTILRRLLFSDETAVIRVSKLLLGTAAVGFALLTIVPWALETSRSVLTHDVPIVDQPLGEVVIDVQDDTSDKVDSTREETAAGAEKEEQSKGKSALNRLYAILAALGVPTLIAGVVQGVLKKGGSKIAMIAAGFVAPLLIVYGFLVSANYAAWTGIGVWVGGQRVEEILWVFIPFAIILVLYFTSDLTATSIHPFYKRRLSTAFALQRILKKGSGTDEIGASERPYDEYVPLYEMKPRGKWPTHICCAAANISDEGRTPPGRRAVTFTFEPDRVGGPEVGYIPTRFYAQVLGKSRAEDITLPAAVAISGAALSPSMGAMTKPSLTFLLALVNARLGVWLPNPRLAIDRHAREAREGAYRAAAELQREGGKPDEIPAIASTEDLELKPWRRPKPRFTWLWKEMRGKNSGNARFLYVTDGGHWENLGLVELLRRGCTKIYCFDAAGDKEQTFFTIGEAMALARSELGVEISLKPESMRTKEGEKYSAADHVYGTFQYPRIKDGSSGRTGSIVFAKAAVTKDAPWDVRAYKERDPAFPNHSLLAQMFADKTFESYRKLGYFTAQKAVSTMQTPPSVEGEAEAAQDDFAIRILTPIVVSLD